MSSLKSALIRILTDDKSPRQPVGAGFLVTSRHVLTCAHVINDALGLRRDAAEHPDIQIWIDVPLQLGQPLLQAKVLHWFPMREESSVGEIEDIAVLELSSDAPLPAEVQPAPIVRLDSGDKSFFAHQVQMCGFPAGIDDGTYAKGTLQDLTAKGWVEIHHQGLELVEEGFSGTAVWAIKESAVCGMIVSVLDRRNAATVAYMIPASTLFSAFPDMPLPVNPYKGLEAFREKDAHFYFGRDEAIAHLKKIAETQSFTAVIGASGSGKSSLVFAGLVPALRKSGDWLIADCRPLNQPFYELSVRLVSFLYEDPLQRSEKTEELKANFDAGTVSLSSVISQIRERHDRRHFLLIIDQFEELYTPNADIVLSRSFLSQVLEAAQTEGFSAVVTLRADFLAAAGSCGVFAGILNSSSPVFIPSIDKENLQQVVERPAALQHVTFEPGLADLIVSEAGDGPGSLPLLEFCLTQIWEKQECRQITHAAYQDIGGVKNAIAVHADDVCSLFNAADKERVRHIFLKLVRPGQGTEDTRQAAVFAQFEPEYHELIKRLADRRLLVTGQDAHSRESTVEIVHEALLHHWTTLREWVDNERNFLVWREKLKVLLRQWRESKQDDSALLRGLPLDEALRWRGSHAGYLTEEERRFVEESEAARVKQRRRKNTAVTVALLIAALVAVMFFLLWKNSERQKVVAVQKTVEAKKEKDKAYQQTLEANYNLAKAFEEKALMTLKRSEEELDNKTCQQAILFAAAALEQKIKTSNIALTLKSIGLLFDIEAFDRALPELSLFNFNGYKDAVTNAVTSVDFSPDGSRLASASGRGLIVLLDIASGKELRVFKGHKSVVASVDFSPDGSRLASASWDGTVRIWDIASGKELHIFKGVGAISVSFSPDGHRLASASEKNRIWVWDITSGKKIFTEYPSSVTSVVFSPDGSRLASGSNDSTVRLWDIATGKELHVFEVLGGVASVDFSPDGSHLAFASGRDIVLFDVASGKKQPVFRDHEEYIASGKELQVFKGHEDNVHNVVFSPDGSRLASGSNDSTVRLWDIATGKELRVFKGHEGVVNSVIFSPDGSRLASGSNDSTVRLWDIATGKGVTTFKGNNSVVASVDFSPDGSRLISTLENDEAQLWDIASGKELQVRKEHEMNVERMALSPDGALIAFAYQDGETVVRDIATSKVKFKSHDDDIISVDSVVFSPDSSLIASVFWSSIVLRDIASGKELLFFKEHGGGSLVFSSDSSRLAFIARENDKTRIWDIATGKELHVFKSINSMALSPDGSLLISDSGYSKVELIDIVTGKKLRFFHHKYPITSVVFSPDGSLLASADSTIRLCDISSGKALQVFKGHEWDVTSISFSPDDSLLASASRDKTVRLWDIASGKELRVFKGYDGDVNSVVFNPDGTSLASAASDTVRLWDIRPYALFLHDYKPTPLYRTFIEAVKFLWQLDVQGLEIVHKERSPADMKRFGSLLAPPPPGQSKFDQVLEWAEKQQGK